MRLTREKLGWAMYDWGNSAYATIVMAGFFPVFFKEYWNAGVAAADSTFRLGLANSVASLVIVFMAPVLGAIADSLDQRRAMLAGFACLGLLMTGGLYLVAQGDWALAATLYVLSMIGFSGSNIFYDALLPSVAGAHEMDQTSALGYSLGYLGGGLLLAVNVYLTLHPDRFGFADAGVVVRLSFLMVAVWWFLFSIPLLVTVREVHDDLPGRLTGNILEEGFVRIWHTLHEVRALRDVWLFLLAYWLYIDGVDTVIRMAVDYGLSLGIGRNDLILALLITQFVGFPAALLFGWAGARFGTKNGILAGLLVYVLVTIVASEMSSAREFYGLAVAIGLSQGGVQALSRSLFARMIPDGRTAEFFGFYNMLGKFAAILGPAMMGGVGLITGNPRAGILSLLLLFCAGALLLLIVPAATGQVAGGANRSGVE
jgi:UMF1 family MFS transporter